MEEDSSDSPRPNDMRGAAIDISRGIASARLLLVQLEDGTSKASPLTGLQRGFTGLLLLLDPGAASLH